MRTAHGAALMRARGRGQYGWLALLAAVALGGCSDSSAGPAEDPAAGLALSSAAVTVVQGQTATVTASITRSGGFTGAVALALEGAPAGLTGTFAPASVPGGATSSTLTLTADAALQPGTYNVTVRGSGTGVTPPTAGLAVTVSAAPAIAVALNPAAVTVAQGAAGTAGITLTRTGGFAGAVDLTLEGAPAGVTGTFAPAQLGAGVTASTLTLNVANTAAQGVHQLTVRAAGTGVAAKTVTLALTVAPGTPQSFALALDPVALTVQQGASGTAKLIATRSGGFGGPIQLSAGGGPAGVSVGFPSPTLNGDTMTLTFIVDPLGSPGGTPLPGVYVLTVSGQAQGLGTQSVQLPLTVSAAPGGFELSVSPAAVTVQAGATARSAVRIARSGGFAGSVTLSVAGAPAGLTATVAETLTLADSVELNLAAAAGLAAGGYPLRVIGQVAGLPNDTTTLNVTVTAVPAGGFTIALNPTAVTVAQGANATSALAITRSGNFNGAVTFSATGAPAGLAVTFDSTNVGGNGTTVRVAAAANLAAGNYNVAVKGNAAGLAEQTVQLAVTVTAGSVGGNVTFRFCPNDLPLFVAVKSGNGAWTKVNASGAGSTDYAFNIANRGGVAYVDDAGFLNVFYASEAEIVAMAGGQCIDSTEEPGGKTLTGNVAGLGQFDQANIVLGGASAAANAAQTNYTLNNVPAGALDLIASQVTLDLLSGSFNASKFILRRNLDLPNNGVIPVLDFGSAEAFAPVTPTLALNGLGADTAYIGMGYFTAANGADNFFGTAAFYYFGQHQAAGNYPGIPAAKQAAGDLHLMMVYAQQGDDDDAPTRGQLSYFTLAANRTVTLGPLLQLPTITTASAGQNLHLRVTLPKQAEYDDVVTANFWQQGRDVSVTATAGYFDAGFTMWDFAIPDLSGIGLAQAWGLNVAATDWTLTGASYSGAGGLLNPVPTNGVAMQYATRAGRYTP